MIDKIIYVWDLNNLIQKYKIKSIEPDKYIIMREDGMLRGLLKTDLNTLSIDADGIQIAADSIKVLEEIYYDGMELILGRINNIFKEMIKHEKEGK